MLRKFFNIPTKSQKEALKSEKQLILQRCSAIARAETNEQRENQKVHDMMCPLCKARKRVDRIVFVQNKGTIFKIGWGIIKGITAIDTVFVNHCGECSHEWEKYKTKAISETSILRVAVLYLQQIINNPKEKKRDWKVETIQIFEGCSAEIIHDLSSIKLSVLRKYYLSIYEVGKDIKLENL